MRLRGFIFLALLGGMSLQPAAASSDDDFCVPHWSLKRDYLDLCSSLPFLSPSNDSRINLYWLLADAGSLKVVNQPLSDYEQHYGYAQVPFLLYRLLETPEPSAQADSRQRFNELLSRLGLPADTPLPNNGFFAGGEGSRCLSNALPAVENFLNQLLSSELLDSERQQLAKGRLALLGACQWDEMQLAIILPKDLQSPDAQAFAHYLKGAADFYSGRFAEALQSFQALQSATQPWLRETAYYLKARNQLNAAQQEAFDEMGYFDLRKVDKPLLHEAESALADYLKAYPQGQYAASAQGLLRRVYWMLGDQQRLAEAYVQLLALGVSAKQLELLQEVDNKLLTIATPADVQTPELLAVLDLMQMRNLSDNERALDDQALAAQKPLFAARPALHDYLLAAYQLYVKKQPDAVLQVLPADIPEKLDYLAFSQQVLRGFALEAKNDWLAAEKLWLSLLPLVQQPLQRQQLELALALNYERSDRLVKVFASGSPVQTAVIREILLRYVAGPELLRQQVRATDASTEERESALFVLLYKDLLHGRYGDFQQDLALLPSEPSSNPLGISVTGIPYGSTALNLFRWQGKGEDNYQCPSIAETASQLQQTPQPAKALNCLGEFILRNNLDQFPLESPPGEQALGGSSSLFPGKPYSRMDGYLAVIANQQAADEERAYALYRAINCYAPSGYNRCGIQDISLAQRKQWFRTLKSHYPNTPWGKSLKYFW